LSNFFDHLFKIRTISIYTNIAVYVRLDLLTMYALYQRILFEIVLRFLKVTVPLLFIARCAEMLNQVP